MHLASGPTLPAFLLYVFLPQFRFPKCHLHVRHLLTSTCVSIFAVVFERLKDGTEIYGGVKGQLDGFSEADGRAERPLHKAWQEV